MSQTGKPPSFSTIPISLHSVDSVRKSCSQRDNMQDHRIQAQWSNESKITATVHIRCTALLGGLCIYGTQVVPPVVEGLNKVIFLLKTQIEEFIYCSILIMIVLNFQSFLQAVSSIFAFILTINCISILLITFYHYYYIIFYCNFYNLDCFHIDRSTVFYIHLTFMINFLLTTVLSRILLLYLKSFIIKIISFVISFWKNYHSHILRQFHSASSLARHQTAFAHVTFHNHS